MKRIRASDIIDFDYSYGRATLDTAELCSPESLQTVRDVVLNVILPGETAHLPLHEREGF